MFHRKLFALWNLKCVSIRTRAQEQAEFAVVAGRGQGSLSGMQSHVRNSDGVSMCRVRRAAVRHVHRVDHRSWSDMSVLHFSRSRGQRAGVRAYCV